VCVCVCVCVCGAALVLYRSLGDGGCYNGVRTSMASELYYNGITVVVPVVQNITEHGQVG
jgi:hypothetical protein